MDHTRWRRIGATLILLSACALDACAGGATGATRSSPSSTPTMTHAPGDIASPTPSPTLTAYSPPCAASQLGLQASFGGVAMGKAVIQYQFTNTSTTACSLKGYPNARLPGHTVKIKQVAISYMWLNVPINTIEMAPSASAYFAIQAQAAPEQPGQQCVTGALSIYPPQSATGFTPPIKVTTCDGVLYISPIVADQSEL